MFCNSIAKLQLEPGLHLGVISGTIMSGSRSGRTFRTVSIPSSISGYKLDEILDCDFYNNDVWHPGWNSDNPPLVCDCLLYTSDAADE